MNLGINMGKENNEEKSKVIMTPVFATKEQEEEFAKSARESMRNRAILTQNFLAERQYLDNTIEKENKEKKLKNALHR